MSFRTEPFSHIYVERGIMHEPKTQAVLARFPDAEVIPAERYHDVFSRPKQDYSVQKHCRSLILARRYGTLLYPGAPVCHSFSSPHFFYASPALNCLYDCEYCWLKGMYSTANIVLFLNDAADYIREAERISHACSDEPVFVSFSYETDLLPLEPLTGFLQELAPLLAETPCITAEVRTKCGSSALIRSLPPAENMILAFTISPEEIIRRYEHGTSPLKQRLAAANTALDCGFPVRFCFDPMILFPGWREAYAKMLETVVNTVDLSRIRDFSVGSYRQSDQYQKRMRSRFPESAVIQYPYEVKNGFCMYPASLRMELECGFREQLSRYADPAKIFLLEDTNDE